MSVGNTNLSDPQLSCFIEGTRLNLPSCLKNFLAELSLSVLLLWIKLDKSPPLQYSIIRNICVSHHCRGAEELHSPAVVRKLQS